MTLHCNEDVLMQGMQLGVIRGIICPDVSEVIQMFGHARATVIGGTMFVMEERSQYFCPYEKKQVQQDHVLLTMSKENKRGREYIQNMCECRICTHRVEWTQSEIYSSGCLHVEFWAAMRQFATLRSFSNWLLRSSFPYIPLFGREAQALVDSQTHSCQSEAIFEEKRSLRAPPESLSDL